jgi:mannose-1-phosphate guanylyltransferase
LIKKKQNGVLVEMNFNNNKLQFVSEKLNEVSRMPNTENSLAVILAGGNGFSGNVITPAKFYNQKPFQFCRTEGGEIVINNARKQVEKTFSPDKTMFVVTEEHKHIYEEILSDVPTEKLIVQPQDRGTTTAILYTALRLALTNPSAILAIFPADFHAPDVNEFMRNVESACAFARRDPNLILLGIKPEDAETKEEWIELDPSAPVDKNFGIWRVSRFSAQATPKQTREFLRNGAFVNSSVIVGTPATFLRKISRYAPEIYERFTLAAERIGTISEERSVRAAYYSNYPNTDFSRDVLEKIIEKLLVVPVQASLRSAVDIEPQAVASVSETVVNSAPKFYVAGV